MAKKTFHDKYIKGRWSPRMLLHFYRVLPWQFWLLMFLTYGYYFRQFLLENQLLFPFNLAPIQAQNMILEWGGVQTNVPGENPLHAEGAARLVVFRRMGEN